MTLTANRIDFANDVRAYRHFAAEFDAPIRCELLYGDTSSAVARIASQYNFARFFPRRLDLDLGLPRYAPVVKALRDYIPDGSQDPVVAVLDLSAALRQTYRKDLLSPASKLLSFLWGRDILPYDNRTFAVLKTQTPNLVPKDYPAFCSAWVARFAECEDQIAEECSRQGASTERWFLERVFDWHLWRSVR
jgi:hypothetical protein